MFATDVCKLPATGSSTVVVVAGLFMLIAGVIVTRWVRQSFGRISVVVVPLLLLGGLVFAPSAIDPCASTVTTTAPATTATPTTTAPPESEVSNDNVLRAYAMWGDSGTWNGDTTDATAEEGEPNDYSDGAFWTVWFKWIATADGQLVLDSCDTSFDSVIGVYTIDDINDPWVTDPADGFTYLGGDDFRAGARCTLPDQNDPAATTVDVIAGTTYYVQLSSYNVGKSGPATLNWDFTPAVIDNRISNDNVANAYDLGTADSGTWNGNTSSATMETNEPYYVGSLSGNNSVWFKFVAWNDGQLVVDTCDASFDTVLTAYSISDIAAPWNDNYLRITSDDASANCAEISQHNPAQVRVGVTNGMTYYIQLDGYVPEEVGQARLSWSFNALMNDNVADAYDMSSSNTGSWNNDTTSATVETGEPSYYFGEPHSTVWFKWRATADGQLIVDACGSSYDTVLSAYTIDDIRDGWNNSVFVDANDGNANCSDSNQISPAVLTVSVTTGQTYYFQLDAFNAPGNSDLLPYSGPAQVNWTFNVPS